jgi:hypothetical protein
MATKSGYRWEPGRHHVGFLRVETDLPLPGSPDHDTKEFAALLTWAEAYRDRRYPNHIVEWKAPNPKSEFQRPDVRFGSEADKGAGS